MNRTLSFSFLVCAVLVVSAPSAFAQIYVTSGGVGMGGETTPQAPLELHDGTGAKGERIAFTGGASYGMGLFDLGSGISSTVSVHGNDYGSAAVSLGFYNRSTQDYASVLIAKHNGRVGIGETAPGVELDVNGDLEATTVTETSDVRLKTAIVPIANALSKLLMLNGVSYQLKEKKQPETHIGLSAQDVEKVFPEVVNVNDVTGMKAVSYGRLVAPLIEAIKEQQAQINDLKARLATIEK